MAGVRYPRFRVVSELLKHFNFRQFAALQARLMEALHAALTAPYELIGRTFDEAPGRPPADFVGEVVARFKALLCDEAALATVPQLTAQSFYSGAVRPNTLVRYVGMIQDMFDPEWFASIKTEQRLGSRVRSSCAFRDVVADRPESAFDDDLQQRYAVRSACSMCLNLTPCRSQSLFVRVCVCVFVGSTCTVFQRQESSPG